MEVTRKGYYTIICPDGLPLTKPDGSIRQVTTRDECYEYITDDAKEYDDEEGTYTISCPDRDVLRTDLSTHQIIPADDVAPTINSTPAPSFTVNGSEQTYDMAQHVSDDGRSTVTYTLNGTLDASLSFNTETGLLTYDGTSGTTYALTLTATDAVGDATSSSFNITITEASAEAFSYIGIPYVTDQVPADLYPTTPTRTNMRAAWPYDPCTIANPTPTPGGASDEYYVKYNGVDAGRGQGTSDLPIRNIPTGTFPAGTKIFIEGNNASSGIEFSAASLDYTMNGIAGNQCWIVGINSPRIATGGTAGGTVFTGSEHVIIDSIVTVPFVDTSNSSRIRLNGGGNSYICLRNSELNGNPNRGGSAGVCFDCSGIAGSYNEFVVLYNNLIQDGGDWQDADVDVDYHGVRAGTSINYLWVIDNEIARFRGNGMQIGNSAGQTEDVSSTIGSFYYVAGNHIHHHNESCSSAKYSANVIYSQNEMNHPGGDGSASAGTALKFTIDNEGKNNGAHWAIFNHLHDCATSAMRDPHERELVYPELSAAIGNLCVDITGPILISEKGKPANREQYYVNNTGINCDSMFDGGGQGSNTAGAIPEMVGNIGYNITDAAAYDLTAGMLNGHVERDVVHRTGGGASITGTFTEDAVLMNTDPLLTNYAGGDYTLQGGSPAVNYLPTIHPIYDTFYDMYGISIKFDYDGNPRPETNVDAGAFERQ